MARTLLLIRHAKAVQGGTPDIGRPLAPRGLDDAKVAGAWLADNRLVPVRAVVSPAVRAQQTWSSIAAQLAAPPAVRTEDRIYDNSVESLLAVLHDVSDDETIVALVGHNPSMHGFAYDLDDGTGVDAARAAIASSYPTSGIAVYEVAGSWREVALGGAALRDFVVPRA